MLALSPIECYRSRMTHVRAVLRSSPSSVALQAKLSGRVLQLVGRQVIQPILRFVLRKRRAMQNQGKHAECNPCDLDRMVLEAVSQDYVPFESIVRKLKDRDVTTSDTIRTSLLGLVASNQVGAYLLHAEPPFYTAVTATEVTLDRFWFFITEEGEQSLRSMTG